MRKMRFIYFFSAFIVYTIAYISLSHLQTIKKLNSLKELNSTVKTRDYLYKTYHKSIEELKDPKEIFRFTKYINASIPSHSTVYKVNGKGIPYFYCLIIQDTLSNKISSVSVKEMK